MTGITGARRVEFHYPDGAIVVVWCCNRCGGYYSTEKQASRVIDGIGHGNTDTGHSCRARPK